MKEIQEKLKKAMKNLQDIDFMNYNARKENQRKVNKVYAELDVLQQEIETVNKQGYILGSKATHEAWNMMIKALVDECIPKGKNIITGKEEYQPNAKANSYLAQRILELLEEK